MTITDKEFIKWVYIKGGHNDDTEFNKFFLTLSLSNGKLDYNILMTAMTNINKSSGNVDGKRYFIGQGRIDFIVFYIADTQGQPTLIKREVLPWLDYDGDSLLALQHALKYIMENER